MLVFRDRPLARSPECSVSFSIFGRSQCGATLLHFAFGLALSAATFKITYESFVNPAVNQIVLLRMRAGIERARRGGRGSWSESDV